MRILDLYSRALAGDFKSHPGYSFFEQPEWRFFEPLARAWEMDGRSIERWMKTPAARAQAGQALSYLKIGHSVVAEVERFFGRELPGTLVWLPSFNEFDGFARYELGEHTVLLGIDLPGTDVDYYRALTAHELSHVYRDHAPRVWGHLGKPLAEITRDEYLEASSAQEHLVSEGLATLFSQTLYPEIPPRVHHFYEEAEWRWCMENAESIHESFLSCLSTDEDVWSYYSTDRAGPGSPSRTQYFWAAKELAARLGRSSEPYLDLLAMHEMAATEFPEFIRKGAPRP